MVGAMAAVRACSPLGLVGFVQLNRLVAGLLLGPLAVIVVHRQRPARTGVVAG